LSSRRALGGSLGNGESFGQAAPAGLPSSPPGDDPRAATTTSRPGLKKKANWYIKSGMDKEFTTVSIPTSLHKKIEEFIKGTEYGSVSSYAAKVLRESLSKAEPATEVFSKEEEDKVKERLKALGYID